MSSRISPLSSFRDRIFMFCRGNSILYCVVCMLTYVRSRPGSTPFSSMSHFTFTGGPFLPPSSTHSTSNNSPFTDSATTFGSISPQQYLPSTHYLLFVLANLVSTDTNHLRHRPV